MENVIRLLSGALAPITALIAVYIAYQQYRINRRKTEDDKRLAELKLRFDLYDKRLAVFQAAMDLISRASNMPEETPEERIPWLQQELSFQKMVAESHFFSGQI